VLGLNFMRRRKSSFIHGAEDDVRELGEHLLRAWGVAPYHQKVPDLDSLQGRRQLA
jgi:hypothetical protein